MIWHAMPKRGSSLQGATPDVVVPIDVAAKLYSRAPYCSKEFGLRMQDPEIAGEDKLYVGVLSPL